MKRLRVSLLALVITQSLFSLAFAEEEKLDATLKLSEGQVAAGIGWSWGKGVLTYEGKSYPFKVDGLSVGDVGIAKADAVGKVYHLKSLGDFNGTFAAVAAEGTVVGGGGASAMKNGNGVVIQLQSTTEGVNFKFAGEGVKFTLEK